VGGGAVTGGDVAGGAVIGGAVAGGAVIGGEVGAVGIRLGCDDGGVGGGAFVVDGTAVDGGAVGGGVTGNAAGTTNHFPPVPWPLVSPGIASPENRYSGIPLNVT
jgi:hypothetical protein